MFRSILSVLVFLLVLVILAACAPIAQPSAKVLATTSFLADIAQNVAGNRIKIDALLPIGVDPHGFEPTPSDVRKIADSTLLVINGAGFEEFLSELLKTAGGKRQIIEASAGLPSRTPTENEILDPDHQGDPHFWLDPNHVVQYVENIRAGLSQIDPAGAATYATNATAYIAQLKELDQWIVAQVKGLPTERRRIVTNHESFGYFADRYGFQIIGTIVPSVSTGAAPSAQQLAKLIDQIKKTQARAIFLETGANPQLAKQVAQETGVKVVVELYTHSVTESSGAAPTYIELMKQNVRVIVEALK